MGIEIKALYESSMVINAAALAFGDTAAFETTEVSGTLSLTTRGPADTGFHVSWGDGDSEWVQHLGTGTDVVTDHVYDATSGTKDIVMSGDLSAIVRFRCTDSLFGGNTSAFSVFTGVNYVFINGTALTGDVGVLLGLANLDTLYMTGTAIVVDLDSLAGNTVLSTWWMSDGAVSGDVVYLAGLTSINSLFMEDTSASGDFGDLATLTGASLLVLRGTPLSYVTTTLPAWSGINLQIQDCGFDATEVDNFLIDLAAAGGTNGSLNIAGTNGTRTSASDTAKATLLANGWALTVNE